MGVGSGVWVNGCVYAAQHALQLLSSGLPCGMTEEGPLLHTAQHARGTHAGNPRLGNRAQRGEPLQGHAVPQGEDSPAHRMPYTWLARTLTSSHNEVSHLRKASKRGYPALRGKARPATKRTSLNPDTTPAGGGEGSAEVTRETW